jgi:ascorbate-specific PTS system EIIC-type component UlaA
MTDVLDYIISPALIVGGLVSAVIGALALLLAWHATKLWGGIVLALLGLLLVVAGSRMVFKELRWVLLLRGDSTAENGV